MITLRLPKMAIVALAACLMLLGGSAHAQNHAPKENPIEAALRHFIEASRSMNLYDLIINIDDHLSMRDPSPHDDEWMVQIVQAASAINAQVASTRDVIDCPRTPRKRSCTVQPGAALITIVDPKYVGDTEVNLRLGAHLGSPSRENTLPSTGLYEYRIRYIVGSGWIAEQAELFWTS